LRCHFMNPHSEQKFDHSAGLSMGTTSTGGRSVDS
jgi:hypothetical protein